MRVFNIEWDTDGEEIEDLPSEVVLPDYIDEADIADALTDMYDWCVIGCEYERD